MTQSAATRPNDRLRGRPSGALSTGWAPAQPGAPEPLPSGLSMRRILNILRGAAVGTVLLNLGACVPASRIQQVQYTCPEVDTGRRNRWVQLSLNGRVLPPSRAQAGDPAAGNPLQLADLSADSIFAFGVITDSARLAEHGFCRGVIAGMITTVAEARRLGLSSPPPALCVSAARYPGEVSVGDTLRLRAGQLDILHECDRPPPGEVRWRSSDEDVFGIDATGQVVGRRPGSAEAIASFETVEARIQIRVRPSPP